MQDSEEHRTGEAVDSSAAQQCTPTSDEQREESKPEISEETLAMRRVTVVAIGASAGGIEAISELLKCLPPDTGMTFVLVQHLDPYHESILPEVLSSLTAMDVQQVRGDTRVEANHVYVIPPNKTLVIEGDTLALNARAAGLHKPIDAFFISLARERGANAIGIILSGNASDGTLGLRAIKAAGGVTIAQDETAKFESMPRSAIAAGVVDLVLAPARIASELVSLVRHAYYVRREQFAVAQDGPVLHRIVSLLRSRMGVDFAQYKQPTIQRRLVRRMLLRKIERLDYYHSLLLDDPAEIEALFQDLLINETGFFRDPEVFTSLKERAFPAILKNHREDAPVRVWVAGCSSGEEVYSIAISLLEYLIAHKLDYPVLLFGTDISYRVIEKARAAVYSNSIVSGLSPELLQRYFTKVDGGYQISRTVREMCIFSQHNVAKDPPLSRMDLISCRNLLIYLTATLQKRVLSNLGYALQADGCLLLGTSETLGSLSDLFTDIDGERRIFTRRNKGGTSGFDLQLAIGAFKPDDVRLASRYNERGLPLQVSGIERHIDHLLQSRFSLTGLVINAYHAIIETRGDIARFLSQRSRPQNEIEGVDLLEAVHEDLRPSIEEVITQAQLQRRIQRIENIRQRRDGRGPSLVDLTVLPLGSQDFLESFLVLFEDVESRENRPGSTADERSVSGEAEMRVSELQHELASTRNHLQAIIQELRSINEEALSANEELQSTNEELQTAKEELHCSNEELNTINAEMQGRNAELAQVNDDLTNLLSSMNMPIVMVSRDLRIRRFTPLASSVLRLIPSDIGRPISDLQPRLNLRDLHKILHGVLDSLVPFETEVKDEEKRLHLLRVRPYRKSDHRIEGAVLQLVDIGDLKRSLEETRHARDYAETIIETIGESLVVLDAYLIIRTANRAFYQSFELAPDQTIGRPLQDAGHGQLRHPVLLKALDSLSKQEGNLDGLEIEFDRRRSGHCCLSVNASIISAPNGGKLFLVVFQDITDRKQAAEARYRRVFESARDGIVIADAETGEITDSNPYLSHLTGYSRASVNGKKFWESPLFRNLPQGATALDWIRGQSVARYSDLSIEAADGCILEFEVNAGIYQEGERRVIQFNLRDLTDRRKFDRELQRSARLESVGLLAGGIAHDFNNLLTGVLGSASLIYSTTPPGHPSRSLLREIQHSAERAALLTRQMLAYAGKGAVTKERIALGEFIPEILSLVQTSIPKTVNVTLDLRAETPDVDADPAQLQQLCMNLIINAGEAIGEDRPGKIEIRTSVRDLTAENIAANYPADDLTPGNYALLEVNDSGPGIEEQTRRRIFDPFFTTKSTGRGLGLAAAHGIVRQHGGAIHVSSAPGQGSAFQIVMPAARLPQRVIEAAGRAIGNDEGWGTVLLIEDEAAVRGVARQSLENAKFKVEMAENGREGIEIFRRNPYKFRLVLVDLLMPEVSGEEAIDAIREIRPDVPVVLVSGLDESEAISRMRGKPVQGFLQRPFTPEWLLQNALQALK